MRVLVCGSRDWSENENTVAHDAITAMLDGLCIAHSTVNYHPFVVIHGAASGADSVAKWWCDNSLTAWKYHAQELPYPADWYTHDREGISGIKCSCTTDYCRAAGVRRNKQMLDEGKPTLVLAYANDLSNSRGTRNMVLQAEKAGIPVMNIRVSEGK